MATWIAVVFALVCLLRECKCFDLDPDPKFKEFVPNEPFKFICQSDEPLTACHTSQLSLRDIDYSNSITNYSSHYFGLGLSRAQCGYGYHDTLPAGSTLWYACRARNRKGEWQYATMAAYMGGEVLPIVTGGRVKTPDNSLEGVLSLETPPDKLLVQPGGEVELVYTSNEALSECLFYVRGEPWTVLTESTSAYTIDKSGLDQGKCKLTLHKVTAEQSGFIKSHIKSIYTNGKRRHYMHATTMIVTQAPNSTVLKLDNAAGPYNSGDVMLASCHVGLARPVARVTWLLNNDVIQGEPEDFTTWPWDYQAGGVTWKLKHTVTLDDKNKHLVCRVHHEALPGGFNDVNIKMAVAGVKDHP